jgi:hypothetical protein
MNTNIATEVEKLTNTALPLMEKLENLQKLKKEIRKQSVKLAKIETRENDTRERVAALVDHATTTSQPQEYKGNKRTLSAARKWLADFINAKKNANVNESVRELFDKEEKVNLSRSHGWLHEEERIKIAFYSQNLPKVTSRKNCALHLLHIANKFNCSVGTVSRYADYGEPWNPTKSM